jgi:hypothetical protein
MLNRPMYMNRASDLADMIAKGSLDDYLDDLARVIVDRKAIINHKQMHKWSVGDHATLQNLGMGAKYMNGVEVEVVEIKLKRILVKIVPAGVLFRGRATQVIVHPEFLKAVPGG